MIDVEHDDDVDVDVRLDVLEVDYLSIRSPLRGSLIDVLAAPRLEHVAFCAELVENLLFVFKQASKATLFDFCGTACCCRTAS